MALSTSLKRALARAALTRPSLLRAAAGPPRSVDGPALDPQVQALIRLGDLLREPMLHQLPVRDSRRSMRSQTSIVDLPRAAGVDVHESPLRIASGATLRIRVYRPHDLPRPAPALVYFHGGGFVVGDLASHDGVCSWMAHHARAAVIAVDYRLAPEHPYPAAIEDGFGAWQAIVARRDDLGLGAIGVGGDSAGGCLAAVCCQQARALGLPQPALQLLIYPVTDVTSQLPSRRLFARGFYLEKDSIDWFTRHYLPDPSTHREPRASPLLADDVADLAPAVVLTAGFDALRDEGQRYADRLREAGVPVTYECAATLPHGFWSMGGVVDEARRWVTRISELTGERLRAAPSP